MYIHYEYEAILEGCQSALHMNHLFLYVNLMYKTRCVFYYLFFDGNLRCSMVTH